jgi:hypothetical protein
LLSNGNFRRLSNPHRNFAEGKFLSQIDIALRTPRWPACLLLAEKRLLSRGHIMVLFIVGFMTGGFVTAYLLLGADRWERSCPGDAVQEHAQRWRDQRPLPPFVI